MPVERFASSEGVDGGSVRAALRANGACHLVRAIPADEVLSFHAAARKIFDVSDADKQGCLRRGMSGGFTPPGVEGVRGHGPNASRSFWDTLAPDGGENRYPDVEEGRAYASAAARLFRRLESSALALLRSAYPEVAALADGGRHLLRVFSYSLAPADQVVFPSHLDFGLITAYVGGAAPGLQGLIDGSWTDLTAEPGDLLIGAGTTLRQYDPAVTALRHRVLGSETLRMSASFFAEPRGDAVLPNGRRADDHLRDLTSQIRHEP